MPPIDCKKYQQSNPCADCDCDSCIEEKMDTNERKLEMKPIEETGYRGLDSPKSFDFQQFLSDTDKIIADTFYPNGIKPLTMNVSPDFLESFLHSRLRALLEEYGKQREKKVNPNPQSKVKCCEKCKGQRVIADTDGNTIPACHFCPCHKESPVSQCCKCEKPDLCGFSHCKGNCHTCGLPIRPVSQSVEGCKYKVYDHLFDGSCCYNNNEGGEGHLECRYPYNPGHKNPSGSQCLKLKEEHFDLPTLVKEMEKEKKPIPLVQSRMMKKKIPREVVNKKVNPMYHFNAGISAAIETVKKMK